MNNRTIHSLFEAHAAHYPDHIAAADGAQQITYAALNQRANQLAHYLHRLGVGKDTAVALCIDRSIDFLICILAILKAGGAYLPLDAEQPTERLLFLLKDSQAPLLISSSKVKEKFISFAGANVILDQHAHELSQESTTNLNLKHSAEQLAYIIYTSGSTGTPKGVLIEHHSVVAYSQWFTSYTGCQQQDKIDFSSNPIFDMAISVTLVPLMLGLTIHLCSDDVKKDPQRYLQHLATSQTQIIKLTPSYLKILLHELQNHFIALPHLQCLILGGENLSSTECKLWLELYPEHVLYNEYGPTETTVATSAYKVSQDNVDALDVNVPIGKAEGTICYLILDSKLQPVAEHETGQLYIGGTCLARGYLNQAQLTQEQFIKNPFKNVKSVRLYKTGDLCRLDANGCVEYLGRMDDQVKIRGFRVEPGEIEKHLATHPSIKTVAVVAQKDSTNELRLVAYYIIDHQAVAPKTKELNEFLQLHVPYYMIPAAFIRVDQLPLTANGKLDKKALPLPKLEASLNYVAPVSHLEKQLAQMWSKELDGCVVGLYDNFFELGGHSLSAARLLSKINYELGKQLSIVDFYQAGCIANLASLLEHTKKGRIITVTQSEYVNAQRVPLNDFQFMMWMSQLFEPKVKKLNIVARKRFKGCLNKAILDQAFAALLTKHEALTYHICTFKPQQKNVTKTRVELIERHLKSVSQEHCEEQLNQSIENLTELHPWPENAPLISARLFQLDNDCSELQIAMSHMIADDFSIGVLFTDLSSFYLHYQQQQSPLLIEKDCLFKKYIFEEQQAISQSIEQANSFWRDYLKDASFFAIPPEHVVPDMAKARLPYSSFIEIPRQKITNLHQFCRKNQMSISNGLCAIIAKALHQCCGQYPQATPHMLINIIRSTRDDSIYDQSLGCFLRVEPIKVACNQHEDLTSLSQQIKQSILETSDYQQCPNLEKISATSTLSRKINRVQRLCSKILTPFMSKILRIPPTYNQVLKASMPQLLAFKKNRHFLVNLNVQNDFVTTNHNNFNLFGYKSVRIESPQTDLLAIDYVLETNFFYDHNQGAHQMAISANLQPAFREQIGQEVLRIMNTLTV